MRPAPPPGATDRQLAFIDLLLRERQADDLIDAAPMTIEEASALIAELKERPHRS